MKCPHCGSEKSRVTETRASADADRRIRLCQGCGKTFQTLERICVFAGRAAGYIEAVQAGPALAVVPDKPKPAARPAAARGFVAHLNDTALAHVTPDAQPLLVQWWNESRRSKHKGQATWTEAAWVASVNRVAALPGWRQLLLAQAGVEHGWQSLKPEYVNDAPAQQTAAGRPMPKDPAMLAALEQWPSQTA
jgi:hypothetical protein